jgi:hypothetical protein
MTPLALKLPGQMATSLIVDVEVPPAFGLPLQHYKVGMQLPSLKDMDQTPPDYVKKVINIQALDTYLGKMLENVSMIPTRKRLASILVDAEKEFGGQATPMQLADFILLALAEYPDSLDKNALEKTRHDLKMSEVSINGMAEMPGDLESLNVLAATRFYHRNMAARLKKEILGG